MLMVRATFEAVRRLGEATELNIQQRTPSINLCLRSPHGGGGEGTYSRTPVGPVTHAQRPRPGRGCRGGSTLEFQVADGKLLDPGYICPLSCSLVRSTRYERDRGEL